MDLKLTKILVAFLFGTLRLFFGMLPLKLYNILRRWEEEDDSHTFINHRRHRQVNCALALCQSFGGGVLFATCFLHMMLQVYNSVEELKRLGDLETDYPLSQLTISFGFFFVYFLEEFSHWLITKIPDEQCLHSNNVTTPKKPNTPLTPISNKIGPVDDKVYIIKQDTIESKQELFDIDDNHEKVVFDTLSLDANVLKENEKNSRISSAATTHTTREEMEKIMEGEVKSKQQLMRCILIVLALSFHAVFEGLAIGLQSSISNIWYLFVAVSVHSATILFCIGLEMLLAKTKTRYIFFQMLFLALASPFGILLGLLVTLKSEMDTKAKSLVVVLLEGLSAGTILYITFFEILNREKERRVFRIPRAFCILGGFALMAMLQYLEVHH